MGDAKPAEATSMGNFTQSKYTKSDPEAYFGNIPPENITTVDESKDTVHNLIAVAQLITDTPGQTVIVTSDVHVARVEQTLKTLTVDDVGGEKILEAIQAIRVLSAEAILSTISKANGSNPFEHLVQHYLKSPRNRTNKVVEAFLRSWLTAHPNSFIKASDKASDALRK